MSTQPKVHVDEIEFHLDYIDPYATADALAAKFGVTANAVTIHLRRKGREDLRERLRRNRARHVRFGWSTPTRQDVAA
jgi:hypothetical protein